MVIPLVDDAPKDIKNMPTAIETDPWLKLGLQRLETDAGGTPTGFKRREFWGLIARIETEVQSEHESWVNNYLSYSGVLANARALVHDNDAAVSGTVVIGGAIVIGGITVFGGITVIGSNAVLSDGLIIREKMPVTPFQIWPATWEPRGLTQYSEQLTGDKCGQVLLAFASYVKKILKHKAIAITDTRIRNWQAIDDTNWKQCILDLTVKAESHIALRIWDELSEELQKFINTQPEVFRPFLKDKLSLDVKWV